MVGAYSLSPDFRQITTKSGAFAQRCEHAVDLEQPVKLGVPLLAMERQIYRVVTVNCDKVHLTTSDGALCAIFQAQREDDKLAMTIHDSTGKEVATMQRRSKVIFKDIYAAETSEGLHIARKSKPHLRLFGWTPIHDGQEAIKKRTPSGPLPIYSWGRIEEKAPSFSSPHRYVMTIPYLDAGGSYEIRSQTSSRHRQNVSFFKRRIPFLNTTPAGTCGPQERFITSGGEICASWKRLGSKREQELVVKVGHDPLLLVSFLLSSNQL